jgi:hypothetical protein
MRLVRLPAGVRTDPGSIEAVYDRLSREHRIECAPMAFGDEAFVRIAGQAYNDVEDYRRLAVALLSIRR